ncbi:hypothetical protein [Mycobacteroides abscessus]|uniref:hypothetical protein n=1 Tax=Mycobacteroides abscessus TaxID=36809 RepID=UPI001F20A35F|nr:hypothetical protein [Mycobacteroides abscessus]
MAQLGDTLNAIDRGAVLGILGAADAVLATKQLAERQTAAINAVRELHCRIPLLGHGTGIEAWECEGCGMLHPCPTILAIDEAGA